MENHNSIDTNVSHNILYLHSIQKLVRGVTKILNGVFIENETEKEKIISSFKDEKTKNFAKLILKQNNKISSSLAQNYENEIYITESIIEEIVKIDINLKKIRLNRSQSSGSSQSEVGIIQRLTRKISEMQSTKRKNEGYIKLCSEEVKKIERKISTDEEYLKKWTGEKRVWLDEVNADKLRDLTYDKNFSNDPYRTYEFKLMKLIFEGILLEKIQDSIDEDLKENNNDWLNIIKDEMKIENELNKRLDEKLLIARSEMERRNIIREEEEMRDKLIEKNLLAKKEILAEWESFFEAIWEFEPITKENYDMPFTHSYAGHQELKFNNYLGKTKFFVFDRFKKNCFNAWQFKNLFLSANDFILTEKMKENFLKLAIKFKHKKDEEKRLQSEKEARERGSSFPKEEMKPLNPNELSYDQKDEIIFVYLMEMLKNMEERAQLRTIKPNERKFIVDKMVDDKLTLEEALFKTNEIRKTEKKSEVKLITLKNFEVFSPLMKSFSNLIFVSMGNKRLKIFRNNKHEVLL